MADVLPEFIGNFRTSITIIGTNHQLTIYTEILFNWGISKNLSSDGVPVAN